MKQVKITKTIKRDLEHLIAYHYNNKIDDDCTSYQDVIFIEEDFDIKVKNQEYTFRMNGDYTYTILDVEGDECEPLWEDEEIDIEEICRTTFKEWLSTNETRRHLSNDSHNW
jgi:hypothetical protein